MEIYHGMQPIPTAQQGGVVALGNFDGLHRGHQILLSKARDIAEHRDLPFGVMSFEPHPRSFFGKKNLFRLSPPNLRPLLSEAMGADFVKIYEFNESFSSLTARQFIETTLKDHLDVHTIVCGYDFHYGKGREGSPQMLQDFGEQLGFAVEVIDLQKSDRQDRIFSSSHIREDLRKGDVIAAAHDLGRWWSMRGTVCAGEGQGKFLGFPTANIALDPTCELKPGVYAARLRRLDNTQQEILDGAAYIGSKPTFGDFEPRLEIFLFDFEADLYGQDVLVEFISYLRADQKFETSEALASQMKEDCATAAEVLLQIEKKGDPMCAYELGRFFAP